MYREYYWHEEFGLCFYTPMDSGRIHIPWKTCLAFIEHFKAGKKLITFPNMKLDRVEATMILMKFDVKGRLR